ncbi:GTP-binding protein Rho1 [Boothiomyces macroporosus]|uniref:GTP-binding protein Rho1 n=1 Tax=Boothiomyces macroporosus TaxID=261099 RepID=A0AAD5UEI1_9FUNG|nr:GTP-binding protein Rho1 [Boothiomyces macroporosus]
MLWDSIGDDQYDSELNDSLRSIAYIGTDLVFLCFSISIPESLKNVKRKVRAQCPNIPIVLVGLKKDTRVGPNQISAEEGLRVSEAIGAQTYLECSSMLKQGVWEVFDYAVQILKPKKTKLFKKKKVNMDSSPPKFDLQKIKTLGRTNSTKCQTLEREQKQPTISKTEKGAGFTKIFSFGKRKSEKLPVINETTKRHSMPAGFTFGRKTIDRSVNKRFSFFDDTNVNIKNDQISQPAEPQQSFFSLSRKTKADKL